ncbi:HK97 gp10 family phage protein [Halalkalibacter sp. APA_J-10(15)]|uniref:HK97 gp10 family phage protein n=1 Tax=Halalkalibacter sp. APA_J-10(15) TaxID=2933805 RepID=UPI001FF58440|nr:HK97 gp10 family phage protein [Halalkalibacter sp. APA_J-10(15)]MCK0471395.1 HK97 gp10 family phage protein [Halalkalibacter sp. APA_J-10(15)]
MANIDIAKEITQALKEYTTEVEEGLEKAKEDVAKDTAKTLQRTSPKKTGKYAKGWRAKKDGKGWTVHNANKPGLTHLLEKGYAKVSGGRVSGKPHIYPAEQSAIKEFESKVEKVIRG